VSADLQRVLTNGSLHVLAILKLEDLEPSPWTRFIAEHWGDLASVVSVVLTIIGFALTIRAAVRSRRAAEEAQRTGKEVMERLRWVDSLGDVKKAISLMDEIKRLHRTRKWNILPDRYSEVKRVLSAIKGGALLDGEQRRTLTEAIQQLSGIELQIEKVLANKSEAPKVDRLNEIVTKQIDALVEVLEQIRKKVEEESWLTKKS